MVVRFEVDAFVSDPSSSSSLLSSSPSKHQSPGTKVSRAPHPSTQKQETTDMVKVIHEGAFISQSRLLELKTCPPAHTLRTKVKAYPQLFFSQTPHLYIGKHVNGCFSEIMKNDVSAGDLKEQHDVLVRSGVLKSMVMALRHIQEFARKSGKEGNLALVFEEKALKVYERDVPKGASEGFLPKRIMTRFEASM